VSLEKRSLRIEDLEKRTLLSASVGSLASQLPDQEASAFLAGRQTAAAPVVALGFADINVSQGSPASTVDLTSGFSDSKYSSSQLTYKVVADTNPALFASTAVDAGGQLTLSYDASASGSGRLMVVAVDPTGNFALGTFAVTVTANGEPAAQP